MISIPITNDPNQSFTIAIQLATKAVNLGFFISWNDQAGYWTADISNADTGTILIAGLPLLKGIGLSANLLDQYEYLAIGSAYVVPLSASTSDSPGLGDWGTNFSLIWGD